MSNQAGTFFALFFTAMTLYAIIASACARYRFRFINESGIAILLGIGLSAILKYGFHTNFDLLNSFSFIYFFVPPIIFAEGYNLRKKYLMQNLGYSVLFGQIGTILNFLMLCGFFILVNKNESVMVLDYVDNKSDMHSIEFSLWEITCMASSLSSKDSFAATLMIDHHAVPLLHSLVFGEGIFNDATSLVIFKAANELEAQETLDIIDFLKLILHILIDFIISLAVGIGFGVIGSLILKHLTFIRQNSMYEIMFVFSYSFVSYAFLEAAEYSGVISLLVSGIMLGTYGWYNMTEKAQISSNITVQFIASLSESSIFLFLGLTFFSNIQEVNYQFIFLILLFVFTSRLSIIFGLAFFVGIFNKFHYPLPFRQWVVFFWSGIPRGVLSYAIITTIDSPNKILILNTIQFVVIISTIIFGGSLPLLQDFLITKDIKESKAHINHKKFFKKQMASKRHILEGQGQFLPEMYDSKFQYYINLFNQKYFKPFLIYNYTARMFEIEAMKLLFKEDKWQINMPQNAEQLELLLESEKHGHEHQSECNNTEAHDNGKHNKHEKYHQSGQHQENTGVLDLVIRRQSLQYMNIMRKEAQEYDLMHNINQNAQNNLQIELSQTGDGSQSLQHALNTHQS